MFRFFRRARGGAIVSQLYDRLMHGARQTGFYSRLGVADTLDGRFEMAAVHGTLLVRRLNRADAPGPDIARDLTDALFEGFEIALRETGVGDLAVPKRMKKMAQNYLGRAQAYGAGLDRPDDGELVAAIARNALGNPDAAAAPGAAAIARYMRAAEDRLAGTSLDELLENLPDWPDIDTFSVESAGS